MVCLVEVPGASGEFRVLNGMRWDLGEFLKFAGSGVFASAFGSPQVQPRRSDSGRRCDRVSRKSGAASAEQWSQKRMREETKVPQK